MGKSKVNLNLAKRNYLVFPKNQISLLTENKTTCALPFSFHFSFD